MRPWRECNYSYPPIANHSCAYACNHRYVPTLSETLRSLRESRGWSLGDAARRLHLSRQAISKWESGDTENIKLANLIALCELYSLSVDSLLAGISSAAPVDSSSSKAGECVVREPDHSYKYQVGISFEHEIPMDIRNQYDALTDPGREYVTAAISATLRTAKEIYGTRQRKTAA